MPHLPFAFVPAVIPVGLDFVFCKKFHCLLSTLFSFRTFNFYSRLLWCHNLDISLTWRRYFNLFALYVTKPLLDSRLKLILLLTLTFSILLSFFYFLSFFPDLPYLICFFCLSLCFFISPVFLFLFFSFFHFFFDFPSFSEFPSILSFFVFDCLLSFLVILLFSLPWSFFL